MAVNLPPFPANSMPGSWAWVDWWKRLQDFIKDITNVTEKKTLSNATVVGIPGYATIDVPWVVIANYVQIDITIVMSGAAIAATNASISLGGLSNAPPVPIDDGLCELSAWTVVGSPTVQSIGVGYIHRVGGTTFMYLPDFSLTGYDRIHITGKYNIS